MSPGVQLSMKARPQSCPRYGLPETLVAVQVCTSAAPRASVGAKPSGAAKSDPQAAAKRKNPSWTALRRCDQEMARTKRGLEKQGFIYAFLSLPPFLLGTKVGRMGMKPRRCIAGQNRHDVREANSVDDLQVVWQ